MLGVRREMRTPKFAPDAADRDTPTEGLTMPLDPVAARALRQIRGGAGSPIARLAQMAASRSTGVAPDYYDPEQEALDSLDEYDYGANPTPGDPYPERAPDPGDEARAAAIDAYNRGPKPDADMRGTESNPDAQWMVPADLRGPSRLDPEAPASIPREPRNSAEAIEGLASVLAGLQTGYPGREALAAAPDLGTRYSAAGMAPRVGHPEPDADDFGGPSDEDEDDALIASLRRR